MGLEGVDGQDVKEVYQIMGPGDAFLPLGNKGLETVQSGEVWVEVASVEGERLLIRSVPIVVEGRLTEILRVANSLAIRDQSVAALGRGLLIGGLVVAVAAFGVGWLLADEGTGLGLAIAMALVEGQNERPLVFFRSFYLFTFQPRMTTGRQASKNSKNS